MKKTIILLSVIAFVGCKKQDDSTEISTKTPIVQTDTNSYMSFYANGELIDMNQCNLVSQAQIDAPNRYSLRCSTIYNGVTRMMQVLVKTDSTGNYTDSDQSYGLYYQDMTTMSHYEYLKEGTKYQLIFNPDSMIVPNDLYFTINIKSFDNKPNGNLKGAFQGKLFDALVNGDSLTVTGGTFNYHIKEKVVL